MEARIVLQPLEQCVQIVLTLCSSQGRDSKRKSTLVSAHRADVGDVPGQLVLDLPAAHGSDVGLLAARDDRDLVLPRHVGAEIHAAHAEDAAVLVQDELPPTFSSGQVFFRNEKRVCAAPMATV